MSTMVLVEYIDAHREEFGVEPIHRVLSAAGTQVAPRTYAAKARPPSRRSLVDAVHLSVIRQVHTDNYGV